jgi:hypothetical protein
MENPSPKSPEHYSSAPAEKFKNQSVLKLLALCTEKQKEKFRIKNSTLAPTNAAYLYDLLLQLHGARNDINTLHNITLNTDNKLLTEFYYLFLDAPKNVFSASLTIPVVLRNPTYKTLFWELVFKSICREEFDLHFQKMLLTLGGHYPKKQIFELINFGIGLWRFRNQSSA